MRKSLIILPVAVAALAVSCATTAPSSSASAPAAVRPTAHSSIGAVLEHRAELGLTDDQVTKLVQMEEELRQKDAALRPAGQQDDHDGNARAEGPNGGGGMGPGMNGGGMGGMAGGGGMGGGRHHGGFGGGNHHRSDSANGSGNALRDQLDENDTEAYMRAEEVLTEAQKPLARQIASKYREQLYDWRKAMRASQGSHESAL